MQVGYTGKLPAYGDFVQGGGSLHACKTWNAWAESGLALTRDETNFADTFLTSPIWRFAVAANVFGTAPVAGVFCPSMDKVGRLFPFAVICDLPDGVSPLSACTALGPWFDRLEAAVLAALDPTATINDLISALTDPDPIRANGAAPALAAASGFSALPVTPQGEPVAPQGDPLDLSDEDPDEGDGAWITLGGIDASAHGVMQRGAATDALFARLVTGGHADGI